MTASEKFQGPLADLNVIDFGHYYAGPAVGMLLADQGATVIRIVKPGEPELPEQQYRVFNRNKKLLTVDLKTPEGKAQAESLIKKADILIENFRPGVMQRLGLDYASVSDKNPELIYLSLPGFPSTDKKRAQIQAWEGVMNAASGAYTETHWWRQQLNFPPVYSWVPFCSAHGSMQGAIAVLAALIAREKQGCGTRIEVSMVAAALSGLTPMLLGHASGLAGFSVPKELKSSFAFSSNDNQATQLDKLSQATHALAFSPFHNFYPCRDGRAIMLWVQNVKASEHLRKELEIDDQLLREGIDFSGMLSREQNQCAKHIVANALLSKTADEWETLLGDNGVAVAAIRARNEWMALKPMQKSGIFNTMNDGKSEITVPGNFADVSGPGGTLLDNSFREAQDIDANRAEELFNQHTTNKRLQSDSVPLQKSDLLKGLKVLDLTNLVAGPTSTYTLAQYGAEVIKTDPPDTVNIGLVGSSLLEVNQGKRSILTDVKTASGREVFSRLVCWADVVVHNSVDGVAERLGVTQAQLQLINPNIVVCQFSAYGGLFRHQGGWEKRSGFDNQVQAVSGMMVHYGTLQNPQLHGLITCGDIMGGIGGTFATLLGVYQQRKTGYAGEARCSLARMINYIQLPCMIAENGNSDWGEARGQFTLGESSTILDESSTGLNQADWWRRLYSCSDRWIYVETTEERATILAEVVAGQTTVDGDLLASAFSTKTSADWLARLAEADIACHLVVNGDDIKSQDLCDVSNDAADETAKGSFELFIRKNHPSGAAIVSIAPSWVRVGENQSYTRLTPALRYGQHTTEILGELDYSKDEISALLQDKVTHEYLLGMGSKDKYFYEPEKQS